MPTGKIKFYDRYKGYGFIIQGEGGHDLFFHNSDLIDKVQLEEGYEVEYELTEMSPTEIAELFAQLTERERVLAFRLLPRNRAADVFTKLSYQQQVPLLKNLSRRHQAEILNDMPSNELVSTLLCCQKKMENSERSGEASSEAKGIKRTD